MPIQRSSSSGTAPELAAVNLAAELVEKVIVDGDLSKLSPAERLSYYRAVCDSVGLNPLTKPFEYIHLNGKLRLYALKGATDQLRAIHGISIELEPPIFQDDLVIVTAVARDRAGRVDSDTGAVPIAGLKGEAKANAILKAITKAKRRVTLSMVGLGMLDESEVETIPGAQVVPGGELPTAREVPRLSPAKAKSLHEKLAAAGVDDPLAFASEVTGRRVTDLQELDTAEAKRVWEEGQAQRSADDDVVDVESKPADAPLSVDDFADPVPAEDEEPAGKGKRERKLTAAEAQRLHAKLAAVGLPQDEHHDFASAVLAGVAVTTLTQLTVPEAVEVNAIADRLARGEVEWKGGELVLPPDEEAA